MRFPRFNYRVADLVYHVALAILLYWFVSIVAKLAGV